MEEIHITIGKKLNRIRREKNLSLDKLSDITGVSKSMLGQIERGESIPTVTTLWKIANGLHISFSAFMEEEKDAVKVSLKDIKPLIDESDKYRIYPIFPYESKKHSETYIMEIEENYQHNSDSHGLGVEEYIIVTEGILEIGINDKVYRIGTEEAIKLKVDADHYYRNISKSNVKAILIIYYS